MWTKDILDATFDWLIISLQQYTNDMDDYGKSYTNVENWLYTYLNIREEYKWKCFY